MTRFGLCVVLISLLLSALVLPWCQHLSWWQVFRRCVSIASASSLWLCARLEGRSLRSYGLERFREGKRQFLCGVGLGVAAVAFLLAVGILSHVYRIEIIADRVRLWRTVLTFIPIAALVGVLEELVFRGLILQHLLAYSTTFAIIVSSALYSVVHLKTQMVTLATYRELGGLFLVGWLLSVSYLRTQQLYLSIGLHAALAYGARVNKLLIEFPDPSTAWLFGTTRLVNGAVSWAALLMLGGMIWWTRWLPASQGRRTS